MSRGLSPRGRGNLNWAMRFDRASQYGVYPRVGGATCHCWGLLLLVHRGARSIPAWAGQPAASRSDSTRDVTSVYPRVGGATSV